MNLDGIVWLDFGTGHWNTPSSEQRQASYEARNGYRKGEPDPQPGTRMVWHCSADEVALILEAFRANHAS